MKRFGTKNILNEHSLGQLPSEKLMKMKWNPLTEAVPNEIEDQLEHIEDSIANIKSKISSDANITTSDKHEYLDMLKELETQINYTQKDIDK